MIGAIIVKKLAGSGSDALSRHDLPKFMASFAKDCTLTYPGNFSMSGEWKGKKAIEGWMAKMMKQFPGIEFNIKETYVSNIFALGATNNLAIEWDITNIDREGKEFHNSGVTTIRLKGGKIVAVRDYYFNTDLLKEAWGEA